MEVIDQLSVHLEKRPDNLIKAKKKGKNSRILTRGIPSGGTRARSRGCPCLPVKGWGFFHGPALRSIYMPLD